MPLLRVQDFYDALRQIFGPKAPSGVPSGPMETRDDPTWFALDASRALWIRYRISISSGHGLPIGTEACAGGQFVGVACGANDACLQR